MYLFMYIPYMGLLKQTPLNLVPPAVTTRSGAESRISFAGFPDHTLRFELAIVLAAASCVKSNILAPQRAIGT